MREDGGSKMKGIKWKNYYNPKTDTWSSYPFKGKSRKLKWEKKTASSWVMTICPFVALYLSRSIETTAIKVVNVAGCEMCVCRGYYYHPLCFVRLRQPVVATNADAWCWCWCLCDVCWVVSYRRVRIRG